MKYYFSQEASRSAKDKGIHFTEVSAKTGMAVKEVFEVIGMFAYTVVILFYICNQS